MRVGQGSSRGHGRPPRERALLAVLGLVVAALAGAAGFELFRLGSDDEAAGAPAAQRPVSARGREAPARQDTAPPDPAPLAGTVRGYYRLLATGRGERAGRLVTGAAAGAAVSAPGADDLVDAYGGATTARAGDRGEAVVRFAPWIEIRRDSGCALYERAEFALTRAGVGWRIARFPALAGAARPCDCSAMPWTTTPTRGDGRDRVVEPVDALRRLRPLRAPDDFVVEAAPAGWPRGVARPGLTLGPGGRVQWEGAVARARERGFPVRARDMNVHLIFKAPVDLGCLSFELPHDRPSRRLSVTATPDRTNQHVTTFLPYPRGRHWTKRPLLAARGLTLHVNAVEGGAGELPPLSFTLYAGEAGA